MSPDGAHPSSTAVPRPGLWRGVRCLFSGIGWLTTTPSAWPLALVPIGCALLLTGLLGAASVTLVPDWIQQWLAPDPSSSFAHYGTAALGMLGALLGVVLGVLLGLTLAQPLSGPALEALVRRREQALGAQPRPPTHFLADVGRSLQSLAIGYAVGLPALAMLFILSTVFPPAVVITVPTKMFVVTMMVAWDICDYPLSVRAIPVMQRVRILGRYGGAVMGFSLGLALAALIPCGALLLLPAGVAGAAQLLYEIEQHERSLAPQERSLPALQPAGPQPHDPPPHEPQPHEPQPAGATAGSAAAARNVSTR